MKTKSKIAIVLFLIMQLASAKPFNLLVWNIKKSNNIKWSKDLKEMTKGIDFLLVQEATDQKVITQTITKLFDHFNFYKTWSNKKYTTGVANASKSKPYYTKSYLSPVTEPILKTPKAISLEKYKWGKLDLLIINIHAINFRLISAFKKHITQIDRDLKRHNGPIIFAGDFNTWSKTRKDFLNTYLASNDLREVSINRVHNGPHLDHIYTRGIENVKAVQLDNKSTSDHHPIMLYAL